MSYSYHLVGMVTNKNQRFTLRVTEMPENAFSLAFLCH